MEWFSKYRTVDSSAIKDGLRMVHYQVAVNMERAIGKELLHLRYYLSLGSRASSRERAMSRPREGAIEKERKATRNWKAVETIAI